MNSLAKVFQVVDETRIAPVLINVCHRIRPGMSLPNTRSPLLRFVARALHLFLIIALFFCYQF